MNAFAVQISQRVEVDGHSVTTEVRIEVGCDSFDSFVRFMQRYFGQYLPNPAPVRAGRAFADAIDQIRPGELRILPATFELAQDSPSYNQRALEGVEYTKADSPFVQTFKPTTLVSAQEFDALCQERDDLEEELQETELKLQAAELENDRLRRTLNSALACCKFQDELIRFMSGTVPMLVLTG